MAYKFQLGPAILSGSLTQEGQVLAKDSAISGSSLSLGGVAVTATAAEINKLDGFTGTTAHLNTVDGAAAGVITNNKVVVYDGSGRVKGNSFLIDNTVVIDSDGDVDANSLSVGGSLITSTPAELNKLDGASADVTAAKLSTLSALTDAEIGFIDGVTAGTAAASKALVLDSDSDIAGIGALNATSLSASADLEVGGNITGSGIALADASGIAGTGLANNGGVLDISGVTNDEIDASAAIAFSKLAALNSANILVGNGSNVATSVAMSGDVAISNAGVTTIQAGAVDNDMLAGSIVASKLNGAIFADLETLGAATGDGEFIVATGAGAFAYESGNTARTSLGLGTGDSPTFAGLTVNGDLTVTGSLTYVNTTNLAITDAQITIGSGSSAFANGYGIEFGAMDGGWAQLETATINSDNYLTSSLNFSAPIVYAPTSVITNDWEISSTHISGALPVYASEFHGDGSNLTGITADTATALDMAVASKADGNSLEIDKVNYFADLSADATVSLPASDGGLIGRSLYIKLRDLSNNATATVNTTGASQKVDGQDSIVLESPFAAVRLIYVADNDWRVF